MDMQEVMQMTGTYLAARYTQESINKVAKWCNDVRIPKHRAQIDRLHTTILYSRKHVPALPLVEMMNIPIEVETSNLIIWNTTNTKFSEGGSTRALILTLNAPELVEMHKRLMVEHNATFDFASYDPHMTLSYDIGTATLKSFGEFPKMKLNLSFLYAEDLIL